MKKLILILLTILVIISIVGCNKEVVDQQTTSEINQTEESTYESVLVSITDVEIPESLEFIEKETNQFGEELLKYVDKESLTYYYYTETSPRELRQTEETRYDYTDDPLDEGELIKSAVEYAKNKFNFDPLLNLTHVEVIETTTDDGHQEYMIIFMDDEDEPMHRLNIRICDNGDVISAYNK